MELVKDAKNVLMHAWSIRLALLSAFFSAMEVALPYFAPFVPEHTMSIMAVLVAAAAAVSRIVAQPDMHKAAES